MPDSQSDFDPYYKWLGIPPSEQPPNFYRLLGIPLFESDPEVIQNAVERQTVHVRNISAGPHAALAQQLLNEISRAGVHLLDPARKASYDRQLRDELRRKAAAPDAAAHPNSDAAGDLTLEPGSNQPPTPAEPPPLVPPPIAPPVAPGAVPPADSASPSVDPLGVASPAARSESGVPLDFVPVIRPARRRRQSPVAGVLQIIIGGVIGTSLALLMLWVVFDRDPFGIMRSPLIRPWAENLKKGATDDQQKTQTAQAPRTPRAATQPSAAAPARSNNNTQPSRVPQRPAAPRTSPSSSTSSSTAPRPGVSPPSEATADNAATTTQPAPQPAETPTDANRPLPLPDPVALQAVEAAVANEVLEKHSEQTDQAALTALARQLWNRGTSESDPARRFVLWRWAWDVAVEAGDVRLAAAALEKLSDWFDVRAGAMAWEALGYWMDGAHVRQLAVLNPEPQSVHAELAGLAFHFAALNCDRDPFVADELARIGRHLAEAAGEQFQPWRWTDQRPNWLVAALHSEGGDSLLRAFAARLVEEDGRQYWCATSPAEWAEVVYRFSFPRPLAKAHLRYSVKCLPDSSQPTQIELLASPDGGEWFTLVQLSGEDSAAGPMRGWIELSKHVPHMEGKRSFLIRARLRGPQTHVQLVIRDPEELAPPLAAKVEFADASGSLD